MDLPTSAEVQKGLSSHGQGLSSHLLTEPQLTKLLNTCKQLCYLLAPSGV